MSIGQNLVRVAFVALLISSLIVSICQQGVAAEQNRAADESEAVTAQLHQD